jgi:cytochrome b subunit of formate dehydrogenase
VANCASCHGAHKVLPSTDPASSIHPANIGETCGSCHPGMSAQLAQTTRIHDDPTQGASGVQGLVSTIYIALILAVIGGMVLYVVLDYRRGLLALLRKPQVRRMSRNAVLQHTVLMISFTVLVLTGFALRYSEEAFFRLLFGWDGGFSARGVIHRVAAVVFLAGVVWHVAYLAGGEGRKFLRDMRPGLRDFREARQAMLLNLGRSHQHPHFARFGFPEKAEYWALVWGTVVMGATGILLWVDSFTIRVFSGTFLDVMRIIHLYEAWLAALAILVWHFYSVILKPGVYPGNPSWLTGKMPRDMYEEEHPGDLEMLAETTEGKAPAEEPDVVVAREPQAG